VTRNVFGINPPAPTDPNKANAEPPPKITPNGIMSVSGHVQALFKVAIPAKPGQPAKEQFYILSESQAQDDIEVTKIDEKAGLVTFNNHGTIQELPLASGPASGPAATAQGGPGMLPRLPLPMPGNAPGGGVIRFGGNRFGRGGGYTGTPTGPQSGQPSGMQSGMQPQNTLSAEDQAALITANHAVAAAKGDPTAPIFPPTEFDAEAGVTPNTSSPDVPAPPQP
jgi:hypothetical protein